MSVIVQGVPNSKVLNGIFVIRATTKTPIAYYCLTFRYKLNDEKKDLIVFVLFIVIAHL